MGIEEYRKFIAAKRRATSRKGFDPAESWDGLFEHQKKALQFACEHGRSACFLDTGLGKSRVEAAAAWEFHVATNKPALILTPLAVAQQMKRECEAVGVNAHVIRDGSEVVAGVNIANYERLPKLDASVFGGVVLDESSILKSFAGRTRNALLASFRDCPFKLAATATPSPNDHMELGNHAEFLGVMRQQEMLSKWFINDTSTASQEWRLKRHAVSDFWAWVASWSRCATLPSDLGGDDDGYILPEIDRHIHEVTADRQKDTQGLLFRIPELSATSFHQEKRLTAQARCELAAEISMHDKPVTIWCETNSESSIVSRLIPGAREVRGDMSLDEKEENLIGFADGDFRVIVTKPKIAGFGLNWQHCAHAIFASISFSYEQHYQAVRRSHRFGQKQRVRNDVIVADTEAAIWHALHGKAEKHAEMKRAMADAMKRAQLNAETCIKYDRPIKLAFPEWLKTESSK